jgi:hypothetical protein
VDEADDSENVEDVEYEIEDSEQHINVETTEDDVTEETEND